MVNVFLADQHAEFLQQYYSDNDRNDERAMELEMEMSMMEHLKMSVIYWSLTTLYLLLGPKGFEDSCPKAKVLEFVLSCYDPSGGFSSDVGEVPHIVPTLSAIQILALLDSLHLVSGDDILEFVKGLQLNDGSFKGDVWSEVDTRFSYCGISSVSLVNRLGGIDGPKALEFVLSCRNEDGGFGMLPHCESHAGQVFCCLASIKILARHPDCARLHMDEDLIDIQQTSQWLASRQTDRGGLNGRPGKLEDVCYSWWVLSSLSMAGQLDSIDCGLLCQFIYRCQDERGGIADRPDDLPDVFHTFFGIAGLSLLGLDSVGKIDPIYCLPTLLINKIFGVD